jgi:hypothetical protein
VDFDEAEGQVASLAKNAAAFFKGSSDFPVGEKTRWLTSGHRLFQQSQVFF